MPVHKITNTHARVNKIGELNPTGVERGKKHDIQEIRVFEVSAVKYLHGVAVRVDCPPKGQPTLYLTGSAAVELVKGILMNVDDITFAVDEELRKLITEKYDRQDRESQAVVDCLKRDVAYHVGHVDRVGNQKEKTQEISRQLGNFYAEWGRKLKVVCDRTKTGQERLVALNWIEKNIGEKNTEADGLEAMTDDLLKEIHPTELAKA